MARPKKTHDEILAGGHYAILRDDQVNEMTDFMAEAKQSHEVVERVFGNNRYGDVKIRWNPQLRCFTFTVSGA